MFLMVLKKEEKEKKISFQNQFHCIHMSVRDNFLFRSDFTVLYLKITAMHYNKWNKSSIYWWVRPCFNALVNVQISESINKFNFGIIVYKYGKEMANALFFNINPLI